MAAPKIFYARLSDYTLSATSTNTSYPLTNLQTYFAADVWKSNGVTHPQQLAIDFGSARSCNFLVISGHNFNGIADTSVSLQGADDSGFSTNLVTLSSGLMSASDPLAVTFSATSRRYWRIYFNSTINLTAAPQLGNLFLGLSLDFPYTYDFGARIGAGQFTTTKVRNLQGSVVTAQPYGGYPVLEMNFKMVSDTFKTSFATFMNTVRGGLYPFYFLDTDGTTLYYVNLSGDYYPVDSVRYNLNDIQSLKMEGQLASLA